LIEVPDEQAGIYAAHSHKHGYWTYGGSALNFCVSRCLLQWNTITIEVLSCSCLLQWNTITTEVFYSNTGLRRI